MGNISALIFDLDGVLADTERLHQQIEQAFYKRLGLTDLPAPTFFVGKGCREMWEEMIRRNGATHLDSAALEQEQFAEALLMARREKLQPTDGLMALLDRLDALGIQAAVASSSNQHYVEEIVEILGLEGRFKAMVGGDSVPRRKPAPDVYLKALALLDVPASAAMAIEDSKTGVTAAVSAGLTCCGYRNPSSGDQDLGQAAHLINNLWDAVFLL